MNTIIKKIASFAMPKIQRFIGKFKKTFGSNAAMHSAERYFTGLLSHIPYKNCDMMAEHMEGTSDAGITIVHLIVKPLGLRTVEFPKNKLHACASRCGRMMVC